MGIAGTLVVAAAIAVGLVGVVVPVLPGVILVFGAIVAWAIVERSPTGWVVLAMSFVAIGGAEVLKYVVPTRRLRDRGVPTLTLAIGAIVGVVGFFVIPVVGLPLGFVAAVYLAEWRRLTDYTAAWRSTTTAIKAVGMSVLIEFTGASIAAACWMVGVLA